MLGTIEFQKAFKMKEKSERRSNHDSRKEVVNKKKVGKDL